MNTHKHRFKAEVIVRKVCSCGAEGEPCEACGKWFDLAEMGTDAEGLYFCPACIKAARLHSQGGARKGTR